MEIRKHLTSDLILIDPAAGDKTQLMSLMLDAIAAERAAAGQPLDRDSVWRALQDREESQSTGLGDGFALPHARIPRLARLAICLAILHDPLDFHSIDGQPVQLVCMVLTPAEQPTLALKVAAKLTTVARDPETVRALRAAPDAGAVQAVLARHDLELEIAVTVGDIMRPAPFTVHPETPLREVTHLLMQHHRSATPVVDAGDRLLGEITCDRLFQFGLPDFFNQLKTVSFIRQFDPFEKYFEREAHLTAGAVMSSACSTLQESATLLEVVFELTVRRHSSVYVTRDDRLLGLVDRATVLNQVINF